MQLFYSAGLQFNPFDLIDCIQFNEKMLFRFLSTHARKVVREKDLENMK